MNVTPNAKTSIRLLVRAITFVSCVTMLAQSATAAVVPVTIGWEPGAQSTIAGYRIHVGSTAGVFDQHDDVGMPNAIDGVLRTGLNIENSHNNFISISSYDAMGIESPFSEAMLVLAQAPDPEAEPEPETGPTPVPSDEGGSEDTLMDTITSTVLGLGIRVDGTDAYSGLPDEFKKLKNVKRYLAFGTEYTICDLEGDGVADLVLTNLLRLAESKRMRREPGRILIWNRRPTDAGGVSKQLLKLRADFLDAHTSGIIENHLSCGDIDGDGLQELIVSSGPGGNNTLQILDDIKTGFRHFALPGSPNGVMQVGLDILGAGGNGELHTAAGNVDGDPADEIIVTFNRPLADQVLILEDASYDFAPMQNAGLDSGYMTSAGGSGLADFAGDAVPVAVDLDDDGIDEIVVVHANDSEFLLQMYDDAGMGFEVVP